MSKKLFGKFFIFLLVVGLLFAVAPTGQAQAATTVTTEAQLLAALADPSVTQIELGANFALTATVNVNRAVSIDGKNFTITGPSTGAEVYEGHGFLVLANNVSFSNLTITGSVRSNLVFYRVTGGIVTNVTLSNAAHAGMIVNGSQVTITSVTTSGNVWGGINVDQGVGVTETPLLTVTNVTTHTSPTTGITPAIWVDKGNAAWVIAANGLYTVVPGTPLAYFDVAEYAAAFDEVWVCPSGDCGHPGAGFNTIQGGINIVVSGGTVHVAAGTYAENVDVTKPVTLLGPNAGTPGNGTRVAEAVIQGTTANWFSLYVKPDVPGVTIDGFKFDGANLIHNPEEYAVGVEGDSSNLTVQNNVFVNHNDVAILTSGVYSNDGGQSWEYDKWLTNILIKDNLITNTTPSTSQYNFGIYFQSSLGTVSGNVVTNMRNGIQVQPYWNTPDGGVISGNTFEAYRTGIYFNYTQNATADWEFTGNIIRGIAYPSGLVADRFNAIRVETFSAGHVDFNHNQVLLGASNATEKYLYFENNVTTGTSSATPNWWGSIAGPAAGTFVGAAEYVPWCGDEDCSFLVYLAGSDLQAAIVATPAGGVLYVPDLGPDPDYTGSYTVGGKTLILGEGVTIQASSPCFTVTGDNTIITAETIGMAKCVQSDTYGIEVNAGIKNVVIEGIYFDTDFAGEVYGSIHFAGAIEDVLINDNYFRAYASIVYDGIVFVQQPTGVVEIKGNLFEMSGISGCAVNNYNGTSTIDAQFNSFGSMAGHPASVPGERVCNNVDYTNFTHSDVYLESSATPWLNQEVVGQEFTLTVKANLTKVAGAKFTLKYNPALVALDETSLTNLSGFSPAGLTMFEVDETLGLITFNASTYPAITGANLSLFSAKFTASAVGAALFEVDAMSDEFSMFPGYASSSNVYGYTLLPVTVDLIELPTVASTFGDSYYLVGEARDFTITVTNFDTAYAAPELRITIPTGLTLKYNGTDYTGSLVVDLADLAVNEVVTIDLTATFTAPFNTTAAVLGVKLVDALPTEEKLVEASFSAFAYTKPTVTVGSDPYFLVGVPGDFSVTIDNPATGRNYGDSIVFDIVIEDHVVADISAVSCTMGTQTWVLTGALTQDGDDVTARIVGENGYFTVPADFHPVINCSITYATPGTYAVSGYMVEAIPSPERIVSDTYSATAQVYRQPVISSANLDGPFQAGLAQDVTLTITNLDAIPEPFDLAFSLPEGTVILYNGTEYTCLSTGCPVIPLVAGAVPGDIEFTITFPVGFVGGTADISVSLYDRDTVGAPSPLATLSMEDVVVYANVASVTGTVSMQGRTTRAGVLFTLAGSFDTYTATSINTLSNNVSFANLASGVYAITVEQARYLDITITDGATIDLAELQAIANLMLRAGDATDDNYINGGDASIVGTQYGTGTIADQGDVNFDNKVNIQDLALVGGNFDLQSANPGAANYAYGTWMK